MFVRFQFSITSCLSYWALNPYWIPFTDCAWVGWTQLLVNFQDYDCWFAPVNASQVYATGTAVLDGNQGRCCQLDKETCDSLYPNGQ